MIAILEFCFYFGGGFLLFTFAIFFCNVLIEVHELKECNTPKIKLSAIKKWYVINPSNWMLKDFSVIRVGEAIELRFSVIETILYMIWHKQLKIEDNKKKRIVKLDKVVRAVKWDLENFEKTNNFNK